MDKREIVEAWLSTLCERLDLAVLDDNEFWPDSFKVQVEAADECGLLENIGYGFCWYFPEDEDVDYLYPIASAVMNKVSNEN